GTRWSCQQAGCPRGQFFNSTRGCASDASAITGSVWTACASLGACSSDGGRARDARKAVDATQAHRGESAAIASRDGASDDVQRDRHERGQLAAGTSEGEDREAAWRSALVHAVLRSRSVYRAARLSG